MQRILFAIVGVALVAAGIGAIASLSGRGGVSPVANSQSAATAVPFTDIAHGSRSTVATRVNYFITSADQLNTLWKMIDATGVPPAIDFKTHAVIAAFAGAGAGSAVTISKIEDTSARLVSITIAKPDSACAQKHSAPSPYDVIAVPTTSLPLSHIDVSAIVSCL
ncbi:MAG: hypothetical protein ACYC6X_02545 [Minisyncoccota bacterium]